MGPLYSLTQHKGEIKWTAECDTFHKRIISILTSEPVLVIFDPALSTNLTHTDASSEGYGAILIQRKIKAPHVIAYYSRRTTETESRYHSYELEILAVVRSIENFRHYLYGRHFTVHTDCNALKASRTKRDLTPRVHRWWAVLQSYDFDIMYREGRNMAHADFLSKNPLPNLNITPTMSPPTVTKTDSSLDIRNVQIIELHQGWLTVEQYRDPELILSPILS